MHHALAGSICGILLFSSIALAQNQANNVVATVGTKSITLDEFNKRYEEVKKQAANPPPKKLFLEDLVRYELGLQEAQKRNLEKDPVIADRMRQELYKGLIEKDLGEKVSAIKVSESEMRDYYKNNPEIRTSHILIEIKQGATPAERAAARKRAEEIYAEVKKSKRPFEELVALYTDDISTKKNGGDVGFQSRVSLVSSYYDSALKLKVGEISGIVETTYGFHIIKLTAKRSFEEARKSQIRAAIFEQKRLELFNDYFDGIKRRYKVTVNSDNLK
jgi:parvulin-like peptidyl-prolyl isomerase